MTTAEDYVRHGNDRLVDGDLVTALACFDAALGIDPGHLDAHFGRGFASFQRGDNATAVAELSWCIEAEPERAGVASTYLVRCLARANSADRAGASADYLEAVRRDPRTAAIAQSLTCVGTAQLVVLAEAYPAQMAAIVDALTAA